MSHSFQIYQSPVGTLYLVESDKQLTALVFKKNWPQFKKKLGVMEEKNTPLLKRAMKQLDEYFTGKRRSFDIPFALSGTDFQKRVWNALSKIPFGETKSYKEQAIIVKAPLACRAIGRTNGLNPISIIVPCHRVVGSNGSLTGYGGGLPIKKFLLELERQATAKH